MAEKPPFPLGTVVWAHVEGWPWWPGLVVPYSLTSFLPESGRAPQNEDSKLSVEFFCDGRISVLKPSALIRFETGMHHARISGPYAEAVKAAAKSARRWIKAHCKYARPEVGDIPMMEKELEDELRLLENDKNTIKMLQTELEGLRMQQFIAEAEKSSYSASNNVPLSAIQNSSVGLVVKAEDKQNIIEDVSREDSDEKKLKEYEFSENGDEFSHLAGILDLPKCEDFLGI